MSMNLPIAFIAAASFFAAPSMAQTVYRCGDSYGQQPCPGGTTVNVDDSRSANQRADTLDAVKRDRKTGDAMEKARVAEEGKPAQALLPPAKPPEISKQEDATVVRTKTQRPAYFTAVAPKKPGDKQVRKKKRKEKKAAA